MTVYSISVPVSDKTGASATATTSATVSTTTSTWPTAATTGYGSTTLTTSTQTRFSTAGTYQNLNLTGPISISASNVTLKDCQITIGASAAWAVGISGGLKGIVLENCKLVGAGSKSTGTGVYGIYIQGDSQVTIQACDFGFFGQSIAINGGQIQVLNNYMHDLYSGPGTHYEHIYYGGAGGITDFSLLIQGNYMNNNQIQTAAVYIENYFGAVNNVTVNNNELIGGDFTIYVEGNQNANNITNVTVTNNALGTGIYGYINANKGKAPTYQVTISGNYDYLTNAPVNPVSNPN